MKSLLKYLIVLFAILVSLTEELRAQKAEWIWYPGDFDIYMSNVMQNRRTERGSFFPPFWKMDSHYVLVDFHKEFDLSEAEDVKIYVEGTYNLKIDGKAIFGSPSSILMPAGKHKLSLKVYGQSKVPAIFVDGKTVKSDATWLTTFEDKEWIDASGKTSDKSGTTFVNAGTWHLQDPNVLPSAFKLPVKAQFAKSKLKSQNGYLVDFGKETFGFVKIHGLIGKGNLNLYYGESSAEALSTAYCETLDILAVNSIMKRDSIIPLSKAFRFVNYQLSDGLNADSISMLYEYSPVQERGSFKCSDAELNNIYQVAKYTFQLNTREFFIDGIKRDRWVWSGDAYQSYLMNYYSFFDSETVKRTLFAQRGKDPVTAHINTIMDYSFYWFLGIYDYYRFTGDQKFVVDIYPRMKSLMDYINARENKNGLLEWMPGDWIFIDWADKLSKEGEVSFEQLLYCRSLETMALCADLAGEKQAAALYLKKAESLREKLFKLYWNESKKALVHSRVNGLATDQVTRYANMFGIFFNYFSENQKSGVKSQVLLNDKISKITTPYMRFYELEALCALGEQKYVLEEMKKYWGGMLKLGATSFWEEFNPDKKDDEHLAMYGRPFGKSLCHAWGASPIYLLGKYYLGVNPTSPGYKTFQISPDLGGLEWMEGEVPTPNGEIKIRCTKSTIYVYAQEGNGILTIKSVIPPKTNLGKFKEVAKFTYELPINSGTNYKVTYKAN